LQHLPPKQQMIPSEYAEDRDHVGAPTDLLIQSFLGIVGPDLTPVLRGKGAEAQDVGLSTREHVGRVSESLGELLDDASVLKVNLLGVGLLEDRADQVGHHGLGRFGHPGELELVPIPCRHVLGTRVCKRASTHQNAFSDRTLSVVGRGIDPRTSRFSGARSTN
jgi:hypothetical protein